MSKVPDVISIDALQGNCSTTDAIALSATQTIIASTEGKSVSCI